VKRGVQLTSTVTITVEGAIRRPHATNASGDIDVVRTRNASSCHMTYGPG